MNGLGAMLAGGSLTCLGTEKQCLLVYMYDGTSDLFDNFSGTEKHLPFTVSFLSFRVTSETENEKPMPM